MISEKLVTLWMISGHLLAILRKENEPMDPKRVGEESDALLHDLYEVYLPPRDMYEVYFPPREEEMYYELFDWSE